MTVKAALELLLGVHEISSVGKHGLEEVTDDCVLLLFRGAPMQALRCTHSLLGDVTRRRPTGNTGTVFGVTVHGHLLSDLNLRPKNGIVNFQIYPSQTPFHLANRVRYKKNQEMMDVFRHCFPCRRRQEHKILHLRGHSLPRLRHNVRI